MTVSSAPLAKRIGLTVCATLLALPAFATPIDPNNSNPLVDCGSALATCGTDSGQGTTNSDAAFNIWAADTGSFVLDNLNGLAGTTGVGGLLTTALGNEFSGTDTDAIGIFNFEFAVLQGTSMRVVRGGPVATFTWTLAQSSDAFGFFARNNDAGTISLNAANGGGSASFSFGATSSNSTGDNLFWGISDLGFNVDQVTISTSDPGNVQSFWDRFVYRPVVQVPEPGTFMLMLLGLAGIASARRRKIR